ncbi:MAG: arginase family protein [Chloroflexota bacterium]
MAILGVPTSAGAFAPGQEKAPRALRDARLVERLTEAGLRIVDYGDGPIFRWRPDRSNPRAQNLEAVITIVQETAARVGQALSREQVVLVLGGDCTIELGIVAGHLSLAERIGLIYFDLHPDLNVPESVKAGALDWMGMAHLLGEEKACAPLSHLGPRFPMLQPADVLFFAYGPDNRTRWERELMEQRGLPGVTLAEVAADPEGTASRALAEFESRFDRLLVHFDVDTIDFTDMPLSENTGRNEGLSFEQAMRALTVLVTTEKLSALTITEINPEHGEQGGATVERFVTALVKLLAASRVTAEYLHP